jgi:hypothetical protein
MNNNDLLTGLITQATASGADVVTLRALIEEASEMGAQRVLGQLGLDDREAQKDLIELRQLLAAWRDAKKSAWKAVIEWAVRGTFALLLIGIAWRLGVVELVK